MGGAAVMSIPVIHRTWLTIGSMAGTSWADLLIQLNLLLIVVSIARHLNTRAREREWEAPDATMRMLFHVAWMILLVAILLELRLADLLFPSS